MRYVVDFETTSKAQADEEGEVRVWAVGLTEINEGYKFRHSNEIDFFFKFAMYHGGTYYAHNLKFDGEFISSWLLHNGYTCNQNGRDNLKCNEFTTLISGAGNFYTCTIKFDNETIITVVDSLKIFNFSVDKIAESFNLPINKLKLDHTIIRKKGYELNDKDISYLNNDCEIVARALKLMFSDTIELNNLGVVKMGFKDKITLGSMALHDYKRIVGKKNFDRWFPVVAYDSDIRQSYKGGFTYAMENIRGKDIKEGIVLDVNSLYPHVMNSKLLPYGEGMYYDGKYKNDELYPLYIQMLTCNFTLKKDHIPMLQVKGMFSPFIQTEYVKDSDGHDVTLCMTNVDLCLFLDHYDVYNIEWHGGWKFKGNDLMFKEFIDKWGRIKVQSSIDDNNGMRTISKLIMNSLYGKFAKNPIVSNKYPYLDTDDCVKYYSTPEINIGGLYVPIGSFVTAWARDITIRSAQKVYNRFLYADTDSLHLSGTNVPKELNIDKDKMGYWKIEYCFDSARFLRAKSYIEVINDSWIDGKKIKDKLKVVCAGMPSECHKFVTWDNFNIGQDFNGKLRPKHVKGGIVLTPTKFTINL